MGKYGRPAILKDALFSATFPQHAGSRYCVDELIEEEKDELFHLLRRCGIPGEWEDNLADIEVMFTRFRTQRPLRDAQRVLLNEAASEDQKIVAANALLVLAGCKPQAGKRYMENPLSPDVIVPKKYIKTPMRELLFKDLKTASSIARVKQLSRAFCEGYGFG